MAKRKSRKSSFWSPPAVIGRVVWGRGGFKGAVRKVRREALGPREVARIRVDPDSGNLKKAGVRQRKDGTWEVKPPRPRKPATRATAKQRIAEMQDRVAKESDRHAAYLKAQPKPMTQRVQRTGDGRFNGSVKATPEQRAAAQSDAAVRRAEQAVARAEKHANTLLGYRGGQY